MAVSIHSIFLPYVLMQYSNITQKNNCFETLHWVIGLRERYSSFNLKGIFQSRIMACPWNDNLNGSLDSVNGDLQFLWEQVNFNPHKINTPQPIDKKFDTTDYVREGTPYTEFGRNPSTGGFWANGWNITKIIFLFIYTFFLWSAYRSDPWIYFYAR